MFNVRRKRSPLIDLDPPKPLAVGDVCPLCRQVVQALQTEKTAEPLVTETGTARGDARPTIEAEATAPVVLADGHQVEPVVVSKPKKSRANAPKN